MKGARVWAAVALLAAFAFWPAAASAQCAMCRRALDSPEGRQLIGAFRGGIAVLLVAPFAIFGTVAYLAVRDERRRNASVEPQSGVSDS